MCYLRCVARCALLLLRDVCCLVVGAWCLMCVAVALVVGACCLRCVDVRCLCSVSFAVGRRLLPVVVNCLVINGVRCVVFVVVCCCVVCVAFWWWLLFGVC